ncbi:hypothetical protein ACIPJS_20560 [Streptomyces sp. NPDC086783]|uniref:hypothetical protein n=1 Tax=Streptomyces sp. NPDC086783 TaxID=3365758 RepID=UPI00381BBAE6
MTTLTSRSRARAAYAVAGGLLALGWLSAPVAEGSTGAPAAGATAPADPAPGAADPRADEDGVSTADLVLPVVTVAVAGALASYGYVRRIRRARTRTTPGSAARLHRADTSGSSDGADPPGPAG